MLHIWGRSVYKVLLGIPEGGRPLETARRRLEDCIKMDHQAMKWRVLDWIVVAEGSHRQGALMSAVMNLRIP